MKFFNFGAGSSVSSSVGASFFIHKYPLYHTNNTNNAIPHRLGTKLLRSIQKIRAVIINKNNQSLKTNFFGIRTGTANAEIPKIIHKLKILDQIMFQIDNDQLWFMAAIAERNNSGADVHIANIVSPINNGDNLKNFAILTLEFTNLSAENPNRNNQTINNIIARTILKICDVKITSIIIIWTSKAIWTKFFCNNLLFFMLKRLKNH